MPSLQDLIYKLEEGGGNRVIRIAFISLAAVMLAVGYNAWVYKNFATQEAMDMAQVGRNLSEGRGYSTLFVRPLSIYLLKKHNTSVTNDAARVYAPHPDLENPPVYPTILAGLFKVFRPEYDVLKANGFWKRNYQPEFLICLFNQLLLLGVAFLTFLLARRLFDRAVAWLSAIVVFGTEMLWRFSISGLSTMFLMLIFLALLWLVVFIEENGREPKHPDWRVLMAAIGTGLLVGVGTLTRYSFGWLIVPVVVFVFLFAGAKKGTAALLTTIAFLVVLGPWIARNYQVSGTPFGTAGYAVIENSGVFPEDKLERSIHPNISYRTLVLWYKLGKNARTLVQEDLPRLGGSWLTAFFAVGLMVGFRNPAVRRTRGLVLACLAVLGLVQALGRTHLSSDSPVINTENLLVLLTPMVIVYGVALFYLLLDQVELPEPGMHRFVVVLFGLLACLPMILELLPPPSVTYTYPPYHAPSIRIFSEPFIKPTDITMSDIPWAVAWYGQKQCAGLTLESGPGKTQRIETVSELSSQCGKLVTGLFLSPVTMDKGFRELSYTSWGDLVLLYRINQVPNDFPLGFSNRKKNQFPEMLMLGDYDRWADASVTGAGTGGPK
jgi:hypothetical protein